MKFAHQAATTNQNKTKILTGNTAASGSLLVNDPTKTKKMANAKTYGMAWMRSGLLSANTRWDPPFGK